MRILIILALLVIPASAQTPKPSAQPDYDAIIKRMEAQIESLEKKTEASQKALDESLELERIVRESGITAPRDYYNPRPYYPSSRYASRYYRSYYLRPYPRLFRGSTIYRNYHLW